MENKTVLSIQDISCFGKCSLTVALPIISAYGVEIAIIPSAVLSTHTGGFTGYTFRDLTDDIPDIINHWKKENIKFDIVYTGYLGSIKQMEYILSMKDSILSKDYKYIIDPVMADNGKLYSGFDLKFVEEMKLFCNNADILLPNITEATFLTGMDYSEYNENDKTYIDELIKRLRNTYKSNIILKGLLYEKDKVGIACITKDEVKFYFTDKIGGSFHGTGDCFASSFIGAYASGSDMFESAKKAADFVVNTIKYTIKDDKNNKLIKFEKAIKDIYI